MTTTVLDHYVGGKAWAGDSERTSPVYDPALLAWIDDDQRVVDDLKNRGSVVPQILSLRQDPKVAERADEARIVRLQVCGPYGTDRMAITLLQQQPDQSCGACEFHCLPASRE